MSFTRQSKPDDLPIAITMLASSQTKGRPACVITDGSFYVIGQGDSPELDAVAKYGTKLGSSAMYVMKMPDDATRTFLEKCGLRRLILLQNPPANHDPMTAARVLYVEYAGECHYRLRDMVSSLRQEAAI